MHKIIQRAYRRYRKRPATLAKCAWNASRYDKTRGDRRVSEIMYRSGDTEDYIKNLFCLRLISSACTILLNLLFQQGYISHRDPPFSYSSAPWSSSPPWTGMFKWLENPEFYKYVTKEDLKQYSEYYQYYIRINEHEKYPEFYLYNTKEGYKTINLVKLSEYDNIYINYPNIIAVHYIPCLWSNNRKKFRKISTQAEKAYNMWVSLGSLIGSYTLSTKKSYYTFYHQI